MSNPSLLALLLGAVVTAAAPRAMAQATTGTIALNRFDPASTGDATFGVPTPVIGGHLVPRAHVAFDYADKPFRIYGEGVDTAVVDAQGFLRIDASLALFDRLLVSLDVPVALLSSGAAFDAGGLDLKAPRGVAFGDLRLGVRGRLFGRDESPLQASLSASAFIPTGPAGFYTGDGAWRGALQGILGGQVASRIVWSANGGVWLRASDEPHLVSFGASAAALLWNGRLSIGPEFYGSVALADGSLASGTNGANILVESRTHAELLIGAKLKPFSDIVFGAAGGPGLSRAIGTPTFRLVALVGWSPSAKANGNTRSQGKGPAGDRDDDGFRDDVDACPDEKGELAGDPKKDGCPPADRDRDGVLDLDDSCPNDAGKRSGDAGKNGCPDDGDGDGIFDAKDACPNEPGETSSNARKHGCPADKDDDGVPDAKDACPGVKGISVDDPKQRGCPDDPDGDGVKWPADACPTVKGVPDARSDRNGCPKFVDVKGDELVIDFEIRFIEYGKHKNQTVKPITNQVLTEIRDEIARHSEIELIEIEGHTDDSGHPEFNQRLSEDRARAVRQWLIDAGVPKEKLTTKGYGHSNPAGDNRVVDGRERNRRVVFRIVRKR